MLNNIRIVMANTSHPGNIGAAARAMKAMGLSELYLVAPKIFPHAEITARAAGADDLIAKAHVVGSIEEALMGCRLTMGCSARSRTLSLPLLDPRQCATQAFEMAAHAPVAIVFGNEQHGLSNAELQHCHFQVCIPTDPEFSSLNVAAAIQIIAYEIKMALEKHNGHEDGKEKTITFKAQKPEITNLETLPAAAEEMELFYAHLETTLATIHFLDPKNPRKLMQRLRRFFNRAQPETIELNILRGILTAVLQRKD